MADNILAPASGTSFATDEIGGIHYPRTKIAHGADGAAVDASITNPFPTSDAASQAAIGKLGSFRRFAAITPGSSALTERPDALFVAADGDVTVRHSASATAVTFPADAKSVLPISPTHVTAAPAGTLALFYS